MATVDVTNADNVVPKVEPIDDTLTPDSESLSPEPEGATLPNDGTSTSQEPALIPKRKGGRKPIYATSEERKQRNRQAQAAFRERRTEYIKQLETTIQQHEETLASLQQSHRTAADECLMLRYKNSLLERILLEKGKRTFLSLFFDTNKEIGIDVQAELRLKGSPHLRPMRPGGMTGQASPMQRAMLNRQQSVRQRPVMAPPPIQTVNQAPRSSIMGDSLNSPNVQPTPPSQHSSPSTTRSPGFPLQGMTSPTADVQQRQPLQQFSQHRQVQPMPHNAFQQQARQHNRSMSANTVGQSYRNSRMQAPAPQVQANYYPTSFQKHYDQLGKSTPTTDQEYDAQVDMLDDVDGDDVDADSFIPNFRLPPQTGVHTGLGMQASPPTTASATSDAGNNLSSIPFDYDPMLDADPFGLSASMHFPNPFQNPLRR
ncbi:hypothetical protein H2198_008768 [Neophaeococcomyces mojaviensis]|uniref:Uncharacterized protein n=1 Tax=Neophaeococcomyces mojaviensis TaxID=3383035 RepID=A0ACC2ZWK4_9EURO|nr:hypothetical protein H2198_008768 [Knufia sp. JES_112]